MQYNFLTLKKPALYILLYGESFKFRGIGGRMKELPISCILYSFLVNVSCFTLGYVQFQLGYILH